MERRREMFTEGLVAGLLGYVTIAVFYALVNLAGGESILATPRLLGRELVRPELAESMPAAPVLAFNAVHLLVLLVVGIAISWLVQETERRPRFWFFAFFAGLLGLSFTEAAFFLVADPVLTVLPWWSVVGANLAAGVSVGGYLFRSHRDLLERITEVEREGT